MTYLFGTLFEREHDSARARLPFVNRVRLDVLSVRRPGKNIAETKQMSETNSNSARKYSKF